MERRGEPTVARAGQSEGRVRARKGDRDNGDKAKQQPQIPTCTVGMEWFGRP